jgi:hypothetical protein
MRTRELLVSFAAIATLALVLGAVLAATPPAVSAQTPARDQTDADILYLPVRQELLLVWSEDRGSGHRIFGKRVRFNGLPVGGPTGGEWEITGPTGPSGAKGDQRWPAVLDGLLVWSEKLPGATDYDLYAQRMRGNSRTQGRPVMIAGGPGDQKYADIARSRNTEWLVVWSEDAADAGDIKGLRLSTALTPRSKVIQIAKGPETAEDPTIAADPRNPGYFLVLWTDDRKGNRDIYGTRIAATGIPRGGGATFGHFPVIDAPEDDYAPALLTATIERLPAYRGLRRDTETRSLLMWTRDTVTDGPDVLALRLHGNGFPVGPTISVASGPGTQAWPAAALKTRRGDRSEWMAVWQTDPLGTMDIWGVEVNTNGHVRRPPRPLAAD